jgi:hypothetical protein
MSERARRAVDRAEQQPQRGAYNYSGSGLAAAKAAPPLDIAERELGPENGIVLARDDQKPIQALAQTCRTGGGADDGAARTNIIAGKVALETEPGVRV